MGSSRTYAQELWTGATFRLRLNKSWAAEVEQQFRFDNNITSYGSSFTELGLRYKYNNHVGVKAGYRFTDRSGNVRIPDNRQRFNADVFFNIGSSKTDFVLSYRIRYQRSRIGDEETKPRDYLRNRLSMDYNLTKKTQPYVETELFYLFEDKNELRAMRLTMGLNTQLTKQLELNTFYRLENELNVKRPERVRIIGVMLTYKLRLQRKSKPDEGSIIEIFERL